ncbi:hypothetical protein Tco_0422193, partial [Tanacetum coccineum]
IVDFLNASPIRYALTVSPTVYVSYIEQFWSTAKIKTVNNETQIRAKVDGKTIVITKSYVRMDLHFNDEDGITSLTNIKIFENLQLMGSKSTGWNKFGTNIVSAVICLAKKQKFNFSKLIFDGKKKIFQGPAAILDAEQDSGNIIRTQFMATLNEPTPQGTSSGSGPRRQDTILGEDLLKLETQERYGHDIEINTTSTSITTASINITTVEPVTTAGAPITTAGVSVSTAEPSTPPTITILIEDEDLIIAQTLMKMRSVKLKEKSKEKGVSSDTATTTTTRGVTMQEPSESRTRKIVPPPQHDPKDKGKAKMIEPEKPLKKKD